MVEQIKSKLFSDLMRMSDDYDLSRDILQETCLRYLEHYSGKEASPSLIFTIARNIFIDHMRKKSRAPPSKGTTGTVHPMRVTGCSSGSSTRVFSMPCSTWPKMNGSFCLLWSAATCHTGKSRRSLASAKRT